MNRSKQIVRDTIRVIMCRFFPIFYWNCTLVALVIPFLAHVSLMEASCIRIVWRPEIFKEPYAASSTSNNEP